MTDKIKRGDLRPNWTATLYDGLVPVDLTSADSIRVMLQFPSGIVDERVVTGNAEGLISMAWLAGDTDVVGDILAEVEVTWPTDKPQTFPVDDYLVTRVFEDLGEPTPPP